MGVETFHSPPRAADTSCGDRTFVVGGNSGLSCSLVTLVRCCDEIDIDFAFCASDTPVCFEHCDCVGFFRSDQPVTSGHRCAVIKKWGVLNHYWVAQVVSMYDAEGTHWWATEKVGYSLAIIWM
jgi:hypothetical protein